MDNLLALNAAVDSEDKNGYTQSDSKVVAPIEQSFVP
jgi:hypothetical protein